MNTLDFNTLLDRTHLVTEIKNILSSFDAKCKDINFKKGIYIYGSPGSGKTQFVINLLNEMNYDVIKYDAGDVRNKSLIDTITSDNVSSCNVLNMMNGKIKKIAIVMDEIDGMYNGDKGGITSLIHLIRQKKTKRQKQESVTLNPIICIGNYFVNKKIKELIKVCHAFELKMPTDTQIENIFRLTMPQLITHPNLSNIQNYVQGDIRKLVFINQLYLKSPHLLESDTFVSVFHNKSYNDDANLIVKSLFQKQIPIENHNMSMNETERTIVAYLWHENVVEYLKPINKQKSYPFYLKIIDNMCFADYTDRIMFQNQIWGFTEMSSLMKTFYNNKLYHEWKHNMPKKNIEIDNIRFTKILTKYSTEYNNSKFLFKLCQELDIDKKDMLSFFQELRLFYGPDFLNKSEKLNDAELLFEDTEINKSVIKRIYRYLDKNMKPEPATLSADDDDDIGDFDMGDE